MPWYYAGPEAKPVGPISLDELRARRSSGVLSQDTYVIEHTGQPNESLTWKRYQDVFPANPSFPSLPPVPPAPPAPVVSLSQPMSPAPPHSLFPSAAPPPHPYQPSSPTTAFPDPHYYPPGQKTNAWCAWGFGLGLAGFFLSFCAIGAVLAVPSFFLCLAGLMQVHKNRNQVGKGFAIAGLVLSGVALVISFLVILSWILPIIKTSETTTSEQTSNNSD